MARPKEEEMVLGAESLGAGPHVRDDWQKRIAEIVGSPEPEHRLWKVLSVVAALGLIAWLATTWGMSPTFPFR